MAARKPKPISFDEHIRPIMDNPLDMSLRLAFADWLAHNGHKERTSWIRLCCGDCQYAIDLRASFAPVNWSTRHCTTCIDGSIQNPTVVDPLWRPTRALEKVRPDWWRTPPQGTGYQQCHFGRIVIGELGDPRWIYDGDWLGKAWKEGWLEMLLFAPNDEEQLNRIAEVREECQPAPLILDTTRTRCNRPPEQQYRRILHFAGLHGLVLGPSELSLDALRGFADKAHNLRFLQLLSLQKRDTSIRALEQLPRLAHLRSLVIGNSHPDDDSIRFVATTKQLEFLGLFGNNITDRGLERISEMCSLRYLAINVPRVSRNAIERLRRDCPRVTIHVQGDMRERIGPA